MSIQENVREVALLDKYPARRACTTLCVPKRECTVKITIHSHFTVHSGTVAHCVVHDSRVGYLSYIYCIYAQSSVAIKKI